MTSQIALNANESTKPGLSLTPSLRASLRDGMAVAVMIGAGESYLSVYGIFLSATPLQIALLAALPQFIGSIFQLFALRALHYFKSRRSVIVAGVLVNATVWIGVALLGVLFEKDQTAVTWLIVFASLYYCSAGFVWPIWNSLIGDLVPASVRGRYFGLRSRAVGLYTFVAVILAGQCLDLSKRWADPAIGFFIVFFVAALSRFVSAYWLRGHDDPPRQESKEEYFSFWKFIRRSPKSNFARFAFYVSAINLGANLSAPFFALYMLRDLHFSYIEFTIITATNTVTQFLMMQYWGKISDQFGNKKILNLCGFGVALSPVFWLFGSNIWYLVLIQIYAGVVWSGFNLAAGNFMFDAVSPPKRARCAAFQGVINGTFILVGALLGGYMAGNLPPSLNFGISTWTPASSLFFIFLFSGIIRLIASIIFLPLVREVRDVDKIGNAELIFRISHLRAIGGATFSLISEPFRKRRK